MPTALNAPNIDIPMGDRKISQLLKSTDSETNTALRETILTVSGEEFAPSDAFKRVIAGGTYTTGDNIRIGNFAYGPDNVGTTFIQGGANNYENVIGGNIANINTATSNRTGAPTLTAADGNWSAIIHGYDNVNNGWANVITGYHCSAIQGSNHGTIAGGSNHKIDGTNPGYATISGGTNNVVSANGAVIAGGYNHTATGIQSTVGGGIGNDATGALSTISGGQNSNATNTNATVGGGATNNATGHSSTIAGGLTNTASGQSSTVAGGSTNTASNTYSTVLGGFSNAASGIGSTTMGGRESSALADYSSTRGFKAVASTYGAHAHAAGNFALPGDAQTLDLVLRTVTTDATTKLLYPSGSGLSVSLPDNTTWAFEMTVAARCNTTGESAAYKIQGAVDRATGVASVALVGTPTTTVIAEDNAAWNLTVGVGTGDGSLRFTATGEAAKEIRWVGRLQVTSVSF